MHTLSPTYAGSFLLQWFIDTPFLISYRCWSWHWPHICSACSQGISTVNLLLQLLARVAFLNFSMVVIFDVNETLVHITLGTEAELAYRNVRLGLHTISNSFPVRPEVSNKIVDISLIWY